MSVDWVTEAQFFLQSLFFIEHLSYKSEVVRYTLYCLWMGIVYLIVELLWTFKIHYPGPLLLLLAALSAMVTEESIDQKEQRGRVDAALERYCPERESIYKPLSKLSNKHSPAQCESGLALTETSSQTKHEGP